MVEKISCKTLEYEISEWRPDDPTDLSLIGQARQENKRIIDVLSKVLKVAQKPRTYRRVASKQYLNVAKKKRKSKKEIHKAIGQQLSYLCRNQKSINSLLDTAESQPFPLNRRDQKIFLVKQHIFDQQMKMYTTRTHSIKERIVKIYQPLCTSDCT